MKKNGHCNQQKATIEMTPASPRSTLKVHLWSWLLVSIASFKTICKHLYINLFPAKREDLRAIFYIDGLNLHGRIKEFELPYLKWLDVVELAQELAKQNNHSVVCVKYFTASVHGDEPKDRQKTYVSALKARHNKLLKIIEGKFKTEKGTQCSEPKCREKVGCPKCQKVFKLHIEKRTDVNIACHMMGDLYENKFDVAYLVSGDSDLLKPVENIKNKNKTIIIVSPPDKAAKVLRNAASNYHPIGIDDLKDSLLPNTFIVGNKTYRRPDKWK